MSGGPFTWTTGFDKEMPEASLSRAMQWVNLSYSVWFNRLHQRVGHLFQGRYRAIVADWLG